MLVIIIFLNQQFYYFINYVLVTNFCIKIIMTFAVWAVEHSFIIHVIIMECVIVKYNICKTYVAYGMFTCFTFQNIIDILDKITFIANITIICAFFT
jgi:hypothetical protein